MLLTRRACYGLLAAQHLAEHAGEGSFSANDLAEFYGLPHEALLAKILQRLATGGVLMSNHGIKGGYTLARDPRCISVFDVIKASAGPRRSGIHGEPWRHVESVPADSSPTFVGNCCSCKIEISGLSNGLVGFPQSESARFANADSRFR
jgi:Rrf2 family protein